MSKKFLLRKIIGNREFLDYNPKEFWTATRNPEQVDEKASGAEFMNEAKEEILDKFIKKQKVKSIFEIGIGFGWNFARIAKKFPNIELAGCDISPVQLAHAKKRLAKHKKTNLFEHDVANSLPFNDKKFDLVLSCGVLMHILPRHTANVISELKRISKHYAFLMEENQLHKYGPRHPNNFVFYHDYNKFFGDWKLLYSKELKEKHFIYLYGRDFLKEPIF